MKPLPTFDSILRKPSFDRSELEQRNPNAPLTKQTARELTTQIKQGFESTAALILKAHKLEAWKALGYDSWQSYVRAEFDIEKSHAYRLLNHSQVVENVSSVPNGEKPVCEAQTRPLASEKPATQKRAWQRAVEKSGGKQPTGAEVKDALDEIKRVKGKVIDPAPGTAIQTEWEFDDGDKEIIAKVQASDSGIIVTGRFVETRTIPWEQIKAAMEHFQK